MHWLVTASTALLTALTVMHLFSCITDRLRLRCITKPMLMPAVMLMHVSVCGFRYPLVLAALAFGCVGDVLLMFISRRRVNFVLGLASFLVGHLLYVSAAFLCGLPQASFAAPYGPLRLVLSIAVMLVCCVSAYLFLRPRMPKKLRIPCAVYIFVLTAMAFTMIFSCTGIAGSASLLRAIGGVLFMTSDMILACRVFGVLKGRRINFWVMLTYVAAQALIALGFALI